MASSPPMRAGRSPAAQYLALGVRQSIFVEADRERLYDLYERYRAWLGAAGLYDRNLVAHEWQRYAAPRYDFVVVDEVQDLTTVQLALVLATLKRPSHFLLCGDSNQIVHPNFFSWSRVKTLFWRDEALAQKQELKVLRANFRNGREATRVANALLRIKHRRFGSIDRESNFLVEAVAGEEGTVTVLPDTDAVEEGAEPEDPAIDAVRRAGDARRRQGGSAPFTSRRRSSSRSTRPRGWSTRTSFSTASSPANRAAFAEIAAGVAAADLNGDELDYRRAKDKADKSLEIYKFYVNALYVALTRAIRNVYLIESDTDHPLLRLLDVRRGAGEVKVEPAASSRDDWQKEARKLELQGKQEQADAIRQSILRETPVPWPVFDEARCARR